MRRNARRERRASAHRGAGRDPGRRRTQGARGRARRQPPGRRRRRCRGRGRSRRRGLARRQWFAPRRRWVTSESGLTAAPGIVAVGDCAARPDPVSGRFGAGQHWTDALERPPLTVAALRERPPPARPATTELPYVWSNQYGLMIQFAGRRRTGDVLEIVEGDRASSSFAAVLRGRTTEIDAIQGPARGPVHAVLGVNLPRTFARLRRELARNPSADEHYLQ